MNRGMNHIIYSNLPCYKEYIVRNIILDSICMDILSPWQFCCKKREQNRLPISKLDRI